MGRAVIEQGDCVEWLKGEEHESAQLVICDPPYFQVQDEAWDRQWENESAYLAWCESWLTECQRILRPDGLCYVFGQPGKREQAFLRFIPRACAILRYHDLVIWDRMVGYNERRDSFTPCYEMILVLSKGEPYFDKDVIREPYDRETIERYMKDKRYKDPDARRQHLEKGKYATNLWRVPSLKGVSNEKLGHPSQKPESLIERIIRSSSRTGSLVVDPFCGSGTTAVVSLRAGREFRGVEVDPDYVAMARRRVDSLQR